MNFLVKSFFEGLLFLAETLVKPVLRLSFGVVGFVLHHRVLLSAVILVSGLSIVIIPTREYWVQTRETHHVELLPGNHTIATDIQKGIGINQTDFENRAAGKETFVVLTPNYIRYFVSSDNVGYNYDIDLGNPNDRIGELKITSNQLQHGGNVTIRLDNGDGRLAVLLPGIGVLLVIIFAATVLSERIEKTTPLRSDLSV